MKNSSWRLTVASSLLALPPSTSAVSGYATGVVNAGQDDWALGAFYRRCMNSDVSASVQFNSQTAENKAAVRMGTANATHS